MGEGVNTISKKARTMSVKMDIYSLPIAERIKALRKRENDMKKRVSQLKKTAASLDDLISSIAYEFEMSKEEVRDRLPDLV